MASFSRIDSFSSPETSTSNVGTEPATDFFAETFATFDAFKAPAAPSTGNIGSNGGAGSSIETASLADWSAPPPSQDVLGNTDDFPSSGLSAFGDSPSPSPNYGRAASADYSFADQANLPSWNEMLAPENDVAGVTGNDWLSGGQGTDDLGSSSSLGGIPKPNEKPISIRLDQAIVERENLTTNTVDYVWTAPDGEPRMVWQNPIGHHVDAKLFGTDGALPQGNLEDAVIAYQNRSGDRVYPGTVQVRNQVERFVEAKSFTEGGVGEISPAKYKPGHGWQSEVKAVRDVTENRIAAGYKFYGNNDGSSERISNPDKLSPIASVLDAFGINQVALSLMSGQKTEKDVFSQAYSWAHGLKAPEAFAEVEKVFSKLSLSFKGDLFSTPYGSSSEIEGKVGERKTPYGGSAGEPRSGWDLTAFKSKFYTTHAGQPGLSDHRVLPDGTLVDRSTAEGQRAYDDAFPMSASLPDNGQNFIAQTESGGASNLALRVPDFAYESSSGLETITMDVGKPSELEANPLTISRTEAEITRSIDKPGKISSIRVGDKVYVPVPAVVDWLQYQGQQNGDFYGDLQSIDAEALIKHNESRLSQITIDNGDGAFVSIPVFNSDYVVNTGYATVQGQQGVMRAPKLQDGVTEAKFERYFDEARTSLLDSIEPGAMATDGSVDRTRLVSKIVVSGVDDIVNVATQTPLGLAEGLLRFSSASTGLLTKDVVPNWINNPLSGFVSETADGLGWVNENVVGNSVNFFTDQPRMAHNVTFIFTPTQDVLQPVVQEKVMDLQKQADMEGWGQDRLDRELGNVANQYRHQMLKALESGYVPNNWDGNASTTAIPDFADRLELLIKR